MKVAVDVKDRREATAVKRAMEDDATRAFVVMIGTLLPLAPHVRERVLRFVADKFSDDKEG